MCQLFCTILTVLALMPTSAAQTRPVDTSVCAVAADPGKFDNKMVRLRAKVISGFEIFAISDPEDKCDRMWLTYDGGGPVASTSFGAMTPGLQRGAVNLREDRYFKRFQRLLKAEMYPRSRDFSCVVCNRYEVTAMMTGRLDFAGEHGGFGHMNMAKLQFVLASVEQIGAKDLTANYDAKEYSPTPVHLPTALFRGKVTGPDGKPVYGAEVNVRPASDTEPHLHDATDWTDENGRFKIDVPPGTYLVGVNLDTPPSKHVPFAATFYPGTGAVEKAARFAVQDRESRKLHLRLECALRPRKIPVRVTWPDGKPVENANVWLREVRNPYAVVGGPVSHTDSQGNFELFGFEGIDYTVLADIYVKPGYHPYCAEKVIVQGDSKISGPLEMVLTKSGEVCRGY
jgi:Carboxypeptidase regulatory-like domain